MQNMAITRIIQKTFNIWLRRLLSGLRLIPNAVFHDYPADSQKRLICFLAYSLQNLNYLPEEYRLDMFAFSGLLNILPGSIHTCHKLGSPLIPFSYKHF